MIAVETDFDLLLTGGEVLDGSGAPAQRLDVGVRGGRIAALGDLGNASARQRLDCAALTVAPGFIDAHSHSDAYLLIEPTAPSKLFQGVTTEVVGHCGASAAPLRGEARLPSDWASFSYPGTWRGVAEYRTLLERQGVGMNVLALAGHRNLRMAVMGSAPRPATPSEIDAMARALEEAMDEGMAGFSTGLVYEPSRHARTEEVEALARVAARRGGLHATHLRNEGPRLLEAIDEALDISRRTGVALQIAHLKTAGRANWPLATAATARIDAARNEGLRVHADRYPYLASGTELDVLLPDWSGQDGREAVLARLRDPATRRKVVEDLQREHPPEYWPTVRVGGTWCGETRPFRGQRLDSAAAALGLSPAEALVWIVERDGLRTGGFFFGMCEENLRHFLAQPWLMVGSDASIRAPDGPLSQDHPHPRAYGAHARLLAMAREGGPLTLAETVRRMTSLAADGFGLRDRGRLAVGQCADVAVFDAARVRDVSTYAEPHRLAEGVRHVVVNGVPALCDGQATGRLAGRWLDRDPHCRA